MQLKCREGRSVSSVFLLRALLMMREAMIVAVVLIRIVAVLFRIARTLAGAQRIVLAAEMTHVLT